MDAERRRVLSRALAGWAVMAIAGTIFVALVAAALWMLGTGPARSQNVDMRVSPQPALSNTAVAVKATKGPLLWYSCYNPNATDDYVQFFDSAGAVTVGTTAPTRSFPVPALSATGMVPPSLQTGAVYASSGIQVAATTTANGGTAPGLPLVCDFGYR